MDNENKQNQQISSREEVEKFLSETEFGGYQSIELPYGLRTPGMDRSGSADLVFKYPIEGKSVLDVGCKYGYFCHVALNKGAKRVTGIEITESNVKIARQIVELWGRPIEILQGNFLDIPVDRKYDVVLFLNVLHHILSPVQTMTKLRELALEMVIVEFSTIFDHHTKFSGLQKGCLQMLFRKSPMVIVKDVPYHRTWYFSSQAFLNLFQKQLQLFRKIEFMESPRKKGRLLAFCWA